VEARRRLAHCVEQVACLRFSPDTRSRIAHASSGFGSSKFKRGGERALAV
jgi:hypothetical protein